MPRQWPRRLVALWCAIGFSLLSPQLQGLIGDSNKTSAPGRFGYHGGKVKVPRPRVRDLASKEVQLPSWEAARDSDLLREWVLNLMLLSVSTRKYGRAVRLPEGDLARQPGDGPRGVKP